MNSFNKRVATAVVAFSMVLSTYAQTTNEMTQQEMAEQIAQLQKSVESLQSQMETQQQQSTAAKSSSLYTPEVFGTVMATFNTSCYNGLTRFNVRNSRFGVKGNASRDLSYAIQIDFHNQGSVSVLDSYVRYKRNNFNAQLGQQQIHLTKDLDRGPSSNLFSTRSLAALYSTTYFGVNSDGSEYVKSLGSRDIGLYTSYQYDGWVTPITISAGLFNGTGVNETDWGNSVNFVGRLTFGGKEGFFAGTSIYTGETPIGQGLNIYSGEVSYTGKRLFSEALYQHRVISDGGKDRMGVVVVQGYYKIETPKCNIFETIAPTLRWDYGDNVGYLNLEDEDNNLSLDFIQMVNVHRITAALNFALPERRLRSRIMVGYEKFFMNYNPSDIEYNPLAHDKFTIAFTAAF